MTIRKAIDLLVAWGLVVRRHGSGTYLVRKDVLHQTASLTGLVEVLKRQGKTVTSQVLIFEIMPAPPAIASQLRIQINEQIYFSRRVRFVEGKPLMLEDSYMPVKLFRNLSLQHLEGSKFEYIEQECGILIGGNYESLTPVLADRLLASGFHNYHQSKSRKCRMDTPSRNSSPSDRPFPLVYPGRAKSAALPPALAYW